MCAAHLCVLLLALAASCVGPCHGHVCEPIHVDMCRGLGYNVTSLSHVSGHVAQRDAEATLLSFQPLIQYGCSAQLRFFLCAVFVPMCTDKVAVAIGPCRALCAAVRARCLPVLQGFGFLWPAALNCSRFPPANDHQHMCMEGPGSGQAAAGATATHAHTLPTGDAAVSPNVRGHRCALYARAHAYVHVNATGRCAPRCDADVLFTASDKRLAAAWLSLWAALCFLSSLLALLTFLLDAAPGAVPGAAPGARWRYPERPLLFLALCYNLCSVGWGVVALAGRKAVACGPLLAHPPTPTHIHTHTQHVLLVHDGIVNVNCAAVFVLVYFFGTAASSWWLVLTTTWFLAAALRWSHERTHQLTCVFHVAAWGIPAALTLAVLLLRDVDADELTGTCSVGHHDSRSLLVFVLLPQSLLLLLGLSLLVTGFVSLLRPGGGGGGGGGALLRPGAFAALCALPAACVLATLVYEYWWRDTWLMAAAPTPAPAPALWVFLLRILMTLVVGVTASLWVCSASSLRAWSRLFRRLLPTKEPPPPPPPPKGFPVHCYGQHRVHKQRKQRPQGSETTV